LLIGLLFFANAQVAPAQSADSLRLEQVTREVIEHNDMIAAARYMETAAQSRVSAEGSWPDPMLMVGVANLPTSFDFKEDPMTMTMVGLRQSIPYAGQKGLSADAARAEAEVATLDRRATEVDLARMARYAFSELYYRNRMLDLLKHQLELVHTVAVAAESRLATGQADQHEALSAQAEAWRLEARVLDAIHMLDEARYELNTLRGLAAITAVPALAAPPTAVLPDSPRVWLEAAQRNYPPLARVRRQSAAYGYSGEAAGRMSWPMLELSASYAFRFDNGMEMRDDMVNFEAAFSLPFFEGGSQKDMARSMEAMRQSADAEALQMTREIEAKLLVLHTTASHLVSQDTLYRIRIVPTSEDAFRSALAGYTANRVPYATLLQLLSDVLRDRVAENETSLQLSRTWADIESFTRDPMELAPQPAGP